MTQQIGNIGNTTISFSELPVPQKKDSGVGLLFGPISGYLWPNQPESSDPISPTRPASEFNTPDHVFEDFTGRLEIPHFASNVDLFRRFNLDTETIVDLLLQTT